jgi:uncharacterized protein YbjT (DUF2867 family)
MIVICGATGNTGRPAVETLLAKGERVRAVGRDPKKLEPLFQKGAEAYVGSVEDAASMTKAFEGATAAYVLIPQALHLEDFRGYQERVTDAYAAAIANARVPFVVSLSSIGAQHAEKTGPIVGLHNMEQKLNRIPGLNVLHLRPVHFMENLLMSISPLRTLGLLPGSYPADVAFPWIAAKDIGSYAAVRLEARDFAGSSTQELLGPREMSMKEVAAILGKAIGKPTLSYMQVPFTMLEPALIQMGLPPSSAALFIEMGKAANAGLLVPQDPRSAKNTTPTTFESFAAEVFALAYVDKTTSA